MCGRLVWCRLMMYRPNTYFKPVLVIRIRSERLTDVWTFYFTSHVTTTVYWPRPRTVWRRRAATAWVFRGRWRLLGAPVFRRETRARSECPPAASTHADDAVEFAPPCCQINAKSNVALITTIYLQTATVQCKTTRGTKTTQFKKTTRAHAGCPDTRPFD